MAGAKSKKGDKSPRNQANKTLTPKQEKFCQVYMQGNDASEAYRQSYNAGKMKPCTVNKKAYELLRKGQITARIEELRAGAAEKAELTKSWVLERIMRNVRISMGEETIRLKSYLKVAGCVEEIEVHDRDAGAANRGLELLGKELGMFVDRSEIKGDVSCTVTFEKHILDAIARRDARMSEKGV